MKFIKCINKILIIVVLLFLGCNSQESKEFNINSLYGEWHIVKHDYRGYQKFNLKQAEKIRNSILIFKKNKIYYDNIEFIQNCTFSKIQITKYDTSDYDINYGYGALEYIYTKSELANFKKINLTDSSGNPTCYNNCSIFYFHQDALISLCGGYTYFLIKNKN